MLTLENGQFLKVLNLLLTIQSSNQAPLYFVKLAENLRSFKKKNLCMNFYKSFSHDCQDLQVNNR